VLSRKCYLKKWWSFILIINQSYAYPLLAGREGA